MTRNGNAVSFVSALLLVALLLQGATASLKKELAGPKQSLMIAQITDPHIFDDGWKETGTKPYQYGMDDRRALHWAVDTINERAEKTGVDFVVFTGDLGLENVFFTEPSCSQFPFKSEPGLAPFGAELAAAELALEFDRLQVSNVYLVAGNNDIVDEQVTDYPRFECFISRLQKDLQELPEHTRGFKHVHVEELRLDGAVSAGNYRLAGLNTASFKNHEKRMECASDMPLSPMLQQICPESQMQALRSLLNAGSTSPVLLFTHVPDLLDPYKKLKGFAKPESWDIGSVEKDWLLLADNPKLAGIFAGHFHSEDRKFYGNDPGRKVLLIHVNDGEKTWVAPPLARKNQGDNLPRARGFMWIKVDSSGNKVTVDATPEWYPEVASDISNISVGAANNEGGDNDVMSSQEAKKYGEYKMPQHYFFLLVVGVILAAGLFGGYLNYLLNRESNKRETNKYHSNQWSGPDLILGVGAAFLVPLFLHVIGSDLFSKMHHDDRGNPDYALVLVFAGFCLVASMSARTFITSVSDRVMKKAEEAKKKALENEDRIEKLEAKVVTTQQPPPSNE